MESKSALKFTKQDFDEFFNGKDVVKITFAEFCLKVLKKEGRSFNISQMVTRVRPYANKGKGETQNPFFAAEKDGSVKKLSVVQFGWNMNYAQQVNNALERNGLEANFEAQQNWHEKKFDEYNGAISQHATNESSEEYFDYNPKQTNKIGYKFQDTQNWLSDKEENLIVLNTPIKSAPKNQGLPEGQEVRFQTISMKNIYAMLFDKVWHVIEG